LPVPFATEVSIIDVPAPALKLSEVVQSFVAKPLPIRASCAVRLRKDDNSKKRGRVFIIEIF
jgi:hypothetical protein